MYRPVLLSWLLLSACAASQEEPRACLLQHPSSELQRTVLKQERGQGLEGDAGNDNDDNNENDDKGKNSNANDDKGNNNDDNDDNDDKGSNSNSDQSGSEKGSDEAKIDESSNGTEAEHIEGNEEGHRSGKGHNGKDSGEKQGEEMTLESVRLELLLQVSEKKLKEKWGLNEFADALKSAFAAAAGIEAGRLEILGVRGSTSDSSISLVEKDIKASLQDTPILAEVELEGKNSIVDVEVLPGTRPSDLSPKGVFSSLSEQLGNPKSRLMKGSLKEVLKGAELKKRDGVEGTWPGEAGYRRAVLLPLALSALFCSAL